MITQDIENIKKNGFDVEEIPTGYILSKGQVEGSKPGNILVPKEACEIIQNIGKIEAIEVVNGKRVRM